MENRILIIQAAGEHSANREYRESLSIKRAFDKIGVECMVWGKGYPTFQIPFDEMIRGYNIIFVVENYDFSWMPDLNKYNGVKVFWSIDGHLVLDKHKEFARNQKFNIVLNSCMEATAKWSDIAGVESLWFPNCYDDELLMPLSDVKKTYRIGFCGSSHDERDSILNNLDKKLSEINHSVKKDIFVIGDDMVKAINSYMIHFNMNIRNDINYRTFETLGCRSALLTNYTSGLEKLFDLDKEMIVWYNEDDLANKAHEYINNIPLTMKIAEEGFKRAKSEHTYYVRMKHLNKFLKG